MKVIYKKALVWMMAGVMLFTSGIPNVKAMESVNGAENIRILSQEEYDEVRESKSGIKTAEEATEKVKIVGKIYGMGYEFGEDPTVLTNTVLSVQAETKEGQVIKVESVAGEYGLEVPAKQPVAITYNAYISGRMSNMSATINMTPGEDKELNIVYRTKSVKGLEKVNQYACPANSIIIRNNGQCTLLGESLELFPKKMELQLSENKNKGNLDISMSSGMEYKAPVKYTSSDEDVAVVDSNGEITAKSVGTAIITCTMEEDSTVTDTMTVEVVENKGFSYKEDGYSILNDEVGFDYYNVINSNNLREIKVKDKEGNDVKKTVYYIPIERYKEIYGSYSKLYYNFTNKLATEGWYGNCYGMSITSILFYQGLLDFENYKTKQFQEAKSINEMGYDDIKISDDGTKYMPSLDFDSDLVKLIEQYVVWQEGASGLAWKMNNQSSLEEVLNNPEKIPYMALLQWEDKVGHAIVIDTTQPYKEIIDENSGKTYYEFLVYDCNKPYFKPLEGRNDVLNDTHKEWNQKLKVYADVKEENGNEIISFEMATATTGDETQGVRKGDVRFYKLTKDNINLDLSKNNVKFSDKKFENIFITGIGTTKTDNYTISSASENLLEVKEGQVTNKASDIWIDIPAGEKGNAGINILIPNEEALTIESEEKAHFIVNHKAGIRGVESDGTSSVTLTENGKWQVEAKEGAEISLLNEIYKEDKSITSILLEAKVESGNILTNELQEDGIYSISSNSAFEAKIQIGSENHDISKEFTLSVSNEDTRIDVNEIIRELEQSSSDNDEPGSSSDNDEPGSSSDNDEPGSSSDNDEPGSSSDNDEPGSSSDNDDTGSDTEWGDILEEDRPQDGVIPEGIWLAGVGNIEYTGSKISQKFRVYDHNILLREGIDYTVKYKNNEKSYTYLDKDYNEYEEEIAAGKKLTVKGSFNSKKAPQIILKMKGNYEGSKVIYFKIKPVSLEEAIINTDKLTATYNKKKQTPAVEITWNGKKLKSGRDYTIPEYDALKKDKDSFKNQGEYPLTITGKDNFYGEIPVTFTISNTSKEIAMNKVKVSGIQNMVWTGEELTQTGYSLKYGKLILKENQDYEVSWGENKEAGTGTVIFRGKGTDADGISFIGTKTITFQIMGASLNKASVQGIEKAYEYTGEEIKPKGELRLKKAVSGIPSTLVEGVHYTTSYEKNVQTGTAEVIFTALESGGCTGSIRYKFKITPANIQQDRIRVEMKADKTISGNNVTYAYAKAGSKPEVVVYDNEYILKEGIDYSLTYSNNKKAASASDKKAPTVSIKGKGNYSNTRKLSFNIVEIPLSEEYGITLVANDKVENGKKNGYRTSFKIYDQNGTALSQKDYNAAEVSYTLLEPVDIDGNITFAETQLDKSSIVNAGSLIKITVEGKGIYQGGKVSGTYRIIKKGKDIGNAVIEIENQQYTGLPVEIKDRNQFKNNKVYLKSEGSRRELILGTDIEIVENSYINNIKKGTAKVTIRGINEFGGLRTVSFKIIGRSVIDHWKGLYTSYRALMDNNTILEKLVKVYNGDKYYLVGDGNKDLIPVLGVEGEDLKYGLINYQGEIVVPCEYDYGCLMVNQQGQSYFTKGDMDYVFDKEGNIIFTTEHTILSVEEGVVLVQREAPYSMEFAYYKLDGTLLYISRDDEPLDKGAVGFNEGYAVFSDMMVARMNREGKLASIQEMVNADKKEEPKEQNGIIGDITGDDAVIDIPIGAVNKGFYTARNERASMDMHGCYWVRNITNPKETYIFDISSIFNYEGLSFMNSGYSSGLARLWDDGNYYYNYGTIICAYMRKGMESNYYLIDTSKLKYRGSSDFKGSGGSEGSEYQDYDMAVLTEDALLLKADNITMSNEEYWLFEKDGKYGYVDHKGNVTELYEDATSFYNGKAVVIKGENAYLIDRWFENVSDLGLADSVDDYGEIAIITLKDQQMIVRK